MDWRESTNDSISCSLQKCPNLFLGIFMLQIICVYIFFELVIEVMLIVF